MDHRQRQVLAQHVYPQGEYYTNRIPTPPRIIVPPPATNDSSLYDMTHSQPDFLSTHAQHGAVESHPKVLTWEYNHRRQAQQILPYLYLGPMTVTKEPQWFQEQGITLVLGVRSKLVKVMDVALQRVRDMGIEAQYIDVPDESHLIRSFPTTTSIIKEHLVRLDNAGQLGRVLVCCESGNDRSASIVTAFIMEVHIDVDHVKAVQLCQAQRFCSMFTDDSKRALQSYWDILTAQRTVAQHQQHDSRGQLNTRKRAVDEDSDDTDEIMYAQAERREYAPFWE